MNPLAQAAGLGLQSRGLTLATAESCTGGLLAAELTSIPGSSAWFERGFVSYSNAAKQHQLGVPAALLSEHGAVSPEVVAAMVRGAVEHSAAQVAIAITGSAGPEGGTPAKPVGTVYIAWQLPGHCDTRLYHFHGERDTIRRHSCDAALRGLLQRLEAPR